MIHANKLWFWILARFVGGDTWSEGFALTGYDIPGCMEDGAWMPWENSSVVAAAAVAAAAVAHPAAYWSKYVIFDQNMTFFAKNTFSKF